MTSSPSSQENVVILHVTEDPDDVARSAHAGAALREWDQSLEVKIVVHGAALTAVVDSDNPIELAEGVAVQACEIGLQRRGLADKERLPGVESIESAVITIVEAQRRGASYIRL